MGANHKIQSNRSKLQMLLPCIWQGYGSHLYSGEAWVKTIIQHSLQAV